MPVARIAASVTLRVELYDVLDGADARLNAEQLALAKVRGFFDKVVELGAAAADPESRQSKEAADIAEGAVLDLFGLGKGGVTSNPEPSSSTRPFFVLPFLAPKRWSFSFNSFRKADELECDIPLAMLPVPVDAIRQLSCYAFLRQITADDWGEREIIGGVWQDGILTEDGFGKSFAGVCTHVGATVMIDGVATVKLKFLDFIGLLANKKTLPGDELDDSLPIDESVRNFIAAVPYMEGIEVVWTDPDRTPPNVAAHKPVLQKKKRSKSSKTPTHGKQSYLDVITQECAKVGVVPRINITRLELAYAGTMYAGLDRGDGIKATFLLGRTVEEFGAEHDLVGLKSQSVAVTSYNPDTGDSYVYRWPPDPKQTKATVVKAGEPPRVRPMAANVGIPGFEELDESVLYIPLAPCANPEHLPQAAQAIFLERTRQKLRYVLKMHAPWTDPAGDQGDVLRLRAGDNVTFGVLTTDEAAGLLAPEIRILAGELSAEAIATQLVRAGVQLKRATKIADALAKTPRTARWRVDELNVSGGEKQDPEIEVKLVNFTVIVSDLQARGDPRSPDDIVSQVIDAAASAAVADLEAIKAAFARAYRELADLDDALAGPARQRLDAALKAATQGR